MYYARTKNNHSRSLAHCLYLVSCSWGSRCNPACTLHTLPHRSFLYTDIGHEGHTLQASRDSYDSHTLQKKKPDYDHRRVRLTCWHTGATHIYTKETRSILADICHISDQRWLPYNDIDLRHVCNLKSWLILALNIHTLKKYPLRNVMQWETKPHHNTTPHDTLPHHSTTPHHTLPHHVTPHLATPCHTTPHSVTPRHTLPHLATPQYHTMLHHWKTMTVLTRTSGEVKPTACTLITPLATISCLARTHTAVNVADRTYSTRLRAVTGWEMKSRIRYLPQD